MKICVTNKSRSHVFTYNPRVLKRPFCGVTSWVHALQCDKITFEVDPPPEISNYDIFLVNLYAQNRHITTIRKANPKAFIIGMPDPHLERFWGEDNTYAVDQLLQADLIGGRTLADVSLFSTLFAPPVAWLPSPIGPTEIFEERHVAFTDKKQHIITIDHRSSPNFTVQNVHALKQLQQRTGLPIMYYNAMPHTKLLCQKANLKVTYVPKVRYPQFVRQVANSLVGVDMYAAHANHRTGMTFSMCKTLLVTSNTCNNLDQYHMPLFANINDRFIDTLSNEDSYTRYANKTFEAVQWYGFAASKKRLLLAIQGVQQ